jgi:ABC-2 type transport system permease protein
VVFLFFGLLSPLTARYINEILAAVGGGIDLVLPEPSYMDAWGQFFKNMSTCMIVFIIMMTGCVAAKNQGLGVAGAYQTRFPYQFCSQ